MEKVAPNLVYGTEIIMTLFTAITLVDLLVANKYAIIAVHSVRVAVYITVVVMASIAIYRGFNNSQVNIYFYFVEAAIILALNIAILVIQSIYFGNKRNDKTHKIVISDVVALIIPTALTAFAIWLLVKQVYRYRLVRDVPKRTTPINMAFTLAVATLLSVMSIITITRKIKEIKETVLAVTPATPPVTSTPPPVTPATPTST